MNQLIKICPPCHQWARFCILECRSMKFTCFCCFTSHLWLLAVLVVRRLGRRPGETIGILIFLKRKLSINLRTKNRGNLWRKFRRFVQAASASSGKTAKKCWLSSPNPQVCGCVVSRLLKHRIRCHRLCIPTSNTNRQQIVVFQLNTHQFPPKDLGM